MKINKCYIGNTEVLKVVHDKVPNILLASNLELRSTNYLIGSYYYDVKPVVGKTYTLTLCYKCGENTNEIAASHYAENLYDTNNFKSKTKTIESRVFTIQDHGQVPNRMDFCNKPFKGHEADIYDENTVIYWATLQEGDTGRQVTWGPADSERYNLLVNTEAPKTKTAPEDASVPENNFVYLVYKLDTPLEVSAGDKFTVSIENIENLKGSPTKYSVRLFNDAPYEGEYGQNLVLTKDNPYVTLQVTKNTTARTILIYAGIAGETAGNSVRYTKVMAVKGDKPMPWRPAESELINDNEKYFWNIDENLNLIKDGEHLTVNPGTDNALAIKVSRTMNSEGVTEYKLEKIGDFAGGAQDMWVFLNNLYIRPVNKIFNKVNLKYTLSFEYKSTVECVVRLDHRSRDPRKIFINQVIPPSSDWKKISISGINDLVSEEYISSLYYFTLSDTAPIGATISFRKPCLVEGDGSEYYLPSEIPSLSHNLLLNLTANKSANVTPINQGVSIQYQNLDTFFSCQLEKTIDFKVGDIYTLSFDVEGLKNDWRFMLLELTNSFEVHNGRNVYNLSITADKSSNHVTIDDTVRIEQSTPFRIKNIKLEKGNVKNPTWSPAKSEVTKNLISYYDAKTNLVDKLDNQTFKLSRPLEGTYTPAVTVAFGYRPEENNSYITNYPYDKSSKKLIYNFTLDDTRCKNIAFGLYDGREHGFVYWDYNFKLNTPYTFSCEILNNKTDEFVFKNCKLEEGTNTNPYFTKNVNDI